MSKANKSQISLLENEFLRFNNKSEIYLQRYLLHYNFVLYCHPPTFRVGLWCRNPGLSLPLTLWVPVSLTSLHWLLHNDTWCFSRSSLQFRRKVSVPCFPERTLYPGLTVWSNLKNPLSLVTENSVYSNTHDKISFTFFSNCFPKVFCKVRFEVNLGEIKMCF